MEASYGSRLFSAGGMMSSWSEAGDRRGVRDISIELEALGPSRQYDWAHVLIQVYEKRRRLDVHVACMSRGPVNIQIDFLDSDTASRPGP